MNLSLGEPLKENEERLHFALKRCVFAAWDDKFRKNYLRTANCNSIPFRDTNLSSSGQICRVPQTIFLMAMSMNVFERNLVSFAFDTYIVMLLVSPIFLNLDLQRSKNWKKTLQIWNKTVISTRECARGSIACNLNFLFRCKTRKWIYNKCETTVAWLGNAPQPLEHCVVKFFPHRISSIKSLPCRTHLRYESGAKFCYSCVYRCAVSKSLMNSLVNTK